MEKPRRHPQTPVIPHEEASHPLPAQDAPARRGAAKPKPTTASLAAIAAAWLNAQTRKPLGLKKTLAAQIAVHCGESRPHQVNPMQLASLVAHWKTHYARNSVAALRSHTLALLRWAEPLTPAAARLRAMLPRVPPQKPRTNVATTEEAQKMLQLATPWLRIFLLTLMDTSLRFDSAYRLAPKHYDRQQQTITIDTKAGQVLTIPVTPRLAEAIASAPQDTADTPFWAAAKGKPINKHSLRRHFHQLVKKAGANHQLVPHDIRRTVAKLIYDHTKELRLASIALGHRSLQTTLRYLEPHDSAAIRPILTSIWTPRKEPT